MFPNYVAQNIDTIVLCKLRRGFALQCFHYCCNCCFIILLTLVPHAPEGYPLSRMHQRVTVVVLCLSVCMCVCVVCVRAWGVCVCLSVCLFICLSVCMSVCMSVCLSVTTFSAILFIFVTTTIIVIVRYSLDFYKHDFS